MMRRCRRRRRDRGAASARSGRGGIPTTGSSTAHAGVPLVFEDVVGEIVAAAAAVASTAVGSRPRSGGHRRRPLSGSDSYRLLTESERPVVVFSRPGSQET
ncbi:UspA domain-containing protein [Haloterrigena salina JCM 13891]|uniref:UspA domain-containing protein n=1 Tax=Haloterrigena salina JCM 13891 TaxID=1227488 RepID=M0C3N3_9EURY|nr:hypothetical protein [Haloterrigena salina]ELZ17283.1 UspA domain-containing protein [Haloterrigena salina JCM 13891]